MVLHFTVNPDGKVSQIDTSETTIAGKALGSCIAHRVRRWEFPSWTTWCGGGDCTPPRPQSVRVNYPLLVRTRMVKRPPAFVLALEPE
jgi:hypothetical protein